jgi:hypothetical protein
MEGIDRLIQVLSWHLPGGTEENHKNPVRMAGVQAEIRTKNLSNKSLQHYL